MTQQRIPATAVALQDALRVCEKALHDYEIATTIEERQAAIRRLSDAATVANEKWIALKPGGR